MGGTVPGRGARAGQIGGPEVSADSEAEAWQELHGHWSLLEP